MFDALLDRVQKEIVVFDSQDKGSPYTQLVLGERHGLPRVQRALLEALCLLKERCGLTLVGKERSHMQLWYARQRSIDFERALNNDQYMRELLEDKMNATTVFWRMYPDDVIVKLVEDFTLRAIAGKIDRRFYRLFSLKKRIGWERMTEEQRLQYEYWLSLMKHILLGDRSDVMVRNLYSFQQQRGTPLAILVCGFMHTPCRKEYEPFSVVRMLRQLPINYIVGTPHRIWQIVGATEEQGDPFDFYTSIDETEVNMYASRKRKTASP